MIIRIENTYANDMKDIQNHLNTNAKRFGSVKKLGQHRFLQLHSACNPIILELKEFSDILVRASLRYILNQVDLTVKVLWKMFLWLYLMNQSWNINHLV